MVDWSGTCHALDSDQHIIFRSAIVLCIPAPHVTRRWQADIVRELHENRRPNEVPDTILAALVPSVGTITLQLKLHRDRNPSGCPRLAPKHVGRKDIPCKYLQSFKENR
jgi:hypothetical protein